MSDLEEKIAEWRKRMAAGGLKSAAVLDELESHLREDIRARLTDEVSEVHAFESAVAQIGSPASLRKEFNEISGSTCLPVTIGVVLWTALTSLLVVLLSGKVVGGRMDLLLFVHTVTLTASYLAAFLAGGFGILYTGWRWSGGLSPEREQSLGRTAYRFCSIAAGLVAVGFLSGMIWSRQNGNGYWHNGPRQMGALCGFVWLVALWWVHRFQKVSDHSRMLLCVLGNVIISQAWFGAVMLAGDSEMRWYRVVSFGPLDVFVGIHLLVLLLAFSRRFQTANS